MSLRSCGLLALRKVWEDIRMKLPHAPATATALTILAATIALPAPARSQRRSRLCCGPTARRRTHCIAPRSSARQDTKFDAKHRTVHPQIRRLVFPDTAPAHISNVSPCDSPLHIKRGLPFTGASSLIVSSTHGTGEAVLKPQLHRPDHGCPSLVKCDFLRSLKF